jgi:magnesium transporter
MDATAALRERLALGVLEDHPDDAAGVLERLPPAAAAALFASAGGEQTADVLGRIDPTAASALVAELDHEDAVGAVAALPLESAARLLRRLAPERVEALLAQQPVRRARALRDLVRFREESAGALMDPDVLALPVDVTAEEALERVRESPDRARYNVYVVDREQKLVGVLNLHELLTAPLHAELSSLMNREPLRVSAEADRRTIVEHPGWRVVTALPVVDADGTYLGALRYRTLRRLESEIARGAPDGASASNALGDLFATAAAGMVEAVLGAPSRGERGGSDVG